MVVGDEGGEPVLEDMSIDLGCADVGMAEQLLNDAKIGAILQQVTGESVTQHVR